MEGQYQSSGIVNIGGGSLSGLGQAMTKAAPALESTLKEVVSLTARLGELASQMRQKADNVFGPQAQLTVNEGFNKMSAPTPAAMTQQISDALGEARDVVSRLEQQFNRFSAL